MRSGQFYAQPSGQAVGRSAGAEKRRRKARRRRKSETREDGRERVKRKRQEEGREKERRAEEEANDEEDRAKAGRSLLQLRERCTHASDSGRVGGRRVDTGGGFKCVTKEVNL